MSYILKIDEWGWFLTFFFIVVIVSQVYTHVLLISHSAYSHSCILLENYACAPQRKENQYMSLHHYYSSNLGIHCVEFINY